MFQEEESLRKGSWKTAGNSRLPRGCVFPARLVITSFQLEVVGEDSMSALQAPVRRLTTCPPPLEMYWHFEWTVYQSAVPPVTFQSYMGHCFKGNLVPTADRFLLPLNRPSFTTAMQGKVWGSGYAFCKTVILYFITKKDQLWKARLNHSFHFLMGFGWIE